jgi:hypothetical protein
MIANSVLIFLLGFFVGPTFPLVLDIATNQNTQGVSHVLYPFIMCSYRQIMSVLPVFPANVQPTALVIG